MTNMKFAPTVVRYLLTNTRIVLHVHWNFSEEWWLWLLYIVAQDVNVKIILIYQSAHLTSRKSAWYADGITAQIVCPRN